MNSPQYTRRERKGKLSFRTKLSQGIGSIPDVIKNWVFNTFALLFYNQVLGVDAFLVSIALAIALLFDAVTDPLVGSFSDNMQTRWGRRHPLMLIASFPLGLAIYAVFVPPEGLGDMQLFSWLLVTTIITRGLMTLYFVPWAAIAPELSDDYHERTSIMAYRYAMGWTISMITPMYIFGFVMVDSVVDGTTLTGQLNPASYPQMAMTCGLIVSVGAILTTLLTWREIPYLRQHVGNMPAFSLRKIYGDFTRAFQNRQFRLLFISSLLAAAITGTTTNISIYMLTFFWELEAADMVWLPLGAAGALVAFPLVAFAQRRWDKKHILITCYAVMIADSALMINLRFLDVLPENGDAMLLVILVGQCMVFVTTLLVSGILGNSLSMDVLDDHELRTGHRQEGMFNAAHSFSTKAMSGIGILMGGLIISLIGFPVGVAPSDVPAQAITNLGIVMGIFVPLLHIFPVLILARYNITQKRHAEIRAAIDQRREQTIGV
ncbi:MFS transporter [Pseudomonadota bacterium]